MFPIMFSADGQKKAATAKAGTLVLIMILSILTALSLERNRIYESEMNMWSDVVKKSPSKQRPHYNYGYALGKGAAHREALAAYEKALSLPYDGRVHLEDILMEMGKSYFALGLYGQAISTWRTWLKTKPGSAKFLNNIAVALLEQRRYQEARTYAQRAVDADPMLASAYNTLGEISFEERNYTTAAAFFINAIKLEPDGAPAYWNAAHALELSGDRERALDYARIYQRMCSDSISKNEAGAYLNALTGNKR